MHDAGVNVRIRGHVQGVGFRWWTRDLMTRLALEGTAVNCADGSVEVTATGAREDLERLVEALGGTGTPGRVDEVSSTWQP